jgi:hypothetical protein
MSPKYDECGGGKDCAIPNLVTPAAPAVTLNLNKNGRRIRRRTHEIEAGETVVSIIRIGLGENKKYGDGWDSIFGGPTPKQTKKKKPAKAAPKSGAAKKKKKPAKRK